MNNTAEQIPTGSTPKNSPVDFKVIIERVKFIAMNPKTCWDTLKNESDQIPDLYRKYFFVLLAVSALAAFIGTSIVGISIPGFGTYRAPFFSGLIFTIVRYAGSLAMLYLAAMVIEKLAPKFEGSTNTVSAFKLVGYAFAPAMALGVLQIFPPLSMIAALGGLYGLYLFYQGLPFLVSLPQERRIPFCIVSLIAVAIAGFVLFFAISMIAPHPAMGDMYRAMGQ